MLGPSWAVLGPSWNHRKPSWGSKTAQRRPKDGPRRPQEALVVDVKNHRKTIVFSMFLSPGAPLEASRSILGGILGCFGACFERSGVQDGLFGPSRSPLWKSWKPLGASWDPRGGPEGGNLGPPWGLHDAKTTELLNHRKTIVFFNILPSRGPSDSVMQASWALREASWAMLEAS